MVASVSKALKGFKCIIDLLNEKIEDLILENKKVKKENEKLKETIKEFDKLIKLI
tara:strand:- start:166 stop:330 length:165 start_codon:yes stop_codon:yes gene_type:complete